MTTVYLNGEFVPMELALIPVEDRGFMFGDGIYEGVRAIDGRLFEWAAHAARMVEGLAGLRIEFGADRVSALRGVCERLLRDNGLSESEAFLYLEVTRGAAPRSHHFPPSLTRPTVLAMASELTVPQDMRTQGVKCITFPDMRWTRCDWKTVNLVGSVLARQAAVEAGAYEAVLLRDGVVTEGAATSLFAVTGGTVRTHPLSHRILPGVTRKVVAELARKIGIPLREEAVTQPELTRVDELFLCGTSTDVTPVVTLDGKPVGDGKPGPITKQLQAALNARLYSVAGAGR